VIEHALEFETGDHVVVPAVSVPARPPGVERLVSGRHQDLADLDLLDLVGHVEPYRLGRADVGTRSAFHADATVEAPPCLAPRFLLGESEIDLVVVVEAVGGRALGHSAGGGCVGVRQPGRRLLSNLLWWAGGGR
jgi:hypothetical protein